MAPRKKKETAKPAAKKINAYIAGSGLTVEQPITETLESNFMPYAMSVIVSRAIPEIDGFKPSHRKLLYTMYKMGLLTGNTIFNAPIGRQRLKSRMNDRSECLDVWRDHQDIRGFHIRIGL